MADEIQKYYKDKIDRYEFGQLIWSNYVLGRLSVPEVMELCNTDLRKRFQEAPPFGFIERQDISSYVSKISKEVKKRTNEDFQDKFDMVVDIVQEVQNVAHQIKEDMEQVRERAQHFFESSENDAAAEQRFFKWDEVLHKDMNAFKEFVQLLASIQGKLQTNITLNVVDEKFKEILAVIRDTETLPNSMKRQLLLEIKDRIEKVRKDLISLPPPKEVKVIPIKVVEPLEIDEKRQ